MNLGWDMLLIRSCAFCSQLLKPSVIKALGWVGRVRGCPDTVQVSWCIYRSGRFTRGPERCQGLCSQRLVDDPGWGGWGGYGDALTPLLLLQPPPHERPMRPCPRINWQHCHLSLWGALRVQRQFNARLNCFCFRRAPRRLK